MPLFRTTEQPSDRTTQRITFILTGNNRSGGVRVTTIMANTLLQRGYNVRIVHKRKRLVSRRYAIDFLKGAVKGFKQTGWLHLFTGKCETYTDINRISWLPGEIAIGIGTYVIPELLRIREPGVIKIRSNHGLPAQMDMEMGGTSFRQLWSVPLRTITVSPTLVPRLEEICNHPVEAVIENGIDTDEYYIQDEYRHGVGTIFHNHPNKAPDDIMRIMRQLHRDYPDIPQYVFSEDSAPRELSHTRYLMYPPVHRVRQWYNRCKIWILASHTEGFPAPVLEAMACGCVVVSSDNDGSLAIIQDGYNGIIVPRGDIDGFAKAVRNLLNDPEKMAHLQNNSRQTVKKYSWENAANKMERYLKSVTRSLGDSVAR